MTALLQAYDPEADWGEPDPRLVNGGVRRAPPLPLEVFGALGPYIADLAASKGSPVDYVAVALLVGAAGSIGAAREVSPRPGWYEPCALWGLNVGSPSSGKSQPFSLVQKALAAIERDEGPDYDLQLAEHAAKVELAKMAEDVWKDRAKKAIRDGSPAPAKPQDAVTPDEPARPRLLVGDATPEALARIFAGNPRGLVLMRDEAAAWLGNFGRYGGDGDAAFYLSTFNGLFAPVDRVKTGGSSNAERALMSFVGGVQPERLNELLFSGRSDDGMIARFLPVWPDPIPPVWKVRAADEDRLVTTLRRLRSLRMGSGVDGRPRPIAMRLAADAERSFAEWWKTNKDAAREGAGLIAGFRGKGDGVVARLALVLELLDWAEAGGDLPPEEVSEPSVLAALTLFEDYLIPMAVRVYGDAGRPVSERNAVALLREALKRRARVINARSVRRDWSVPGLGQVEPVRAALDVLRDGDCIRAADFDQKPGRPREDYLVNPRLFVGAGP